MTASSRNAKIGWQLYVMRPDGTEQRQITEGGESVLHPVLARRHAACSTPMGRPDEHRGIWVVGLDGKDRRGALGPRSRSQCLGLLVARREADRRPRSFDKPQEAEPPKGRLVILEVDGDGRTEFPLDDVKQADMPDWR